MDRWNDIQPNLALQKVLTRQTQAHLTSQLRDSPVEGKIALDAKEPSPSFKHWAFKTIFCNKRLQRANPFLQIEKSLAVRNGLKSYKG